MLLFFLRREAYITTCGVVCRMFNRMAVHTNIFMHTFVLINITHSLPLVDIAAKWRGVHCLGLDIVRVNGVGDRCVKMGCGACILYCKESMVQWWFKIWHYGTNKCIMQRSLHEKYSSAENQKGVNAVQRCSAEKQKGAIAIDFAQ